MAVIVPRTAKLIIVVVVVVLVVIVVTPLIVGCVPLKSSIYQRRHFVTPGYIIFVAFSIRAIVKKETIVERTVALGVI